MKRGRGEAGERRVRLFRYSFVALAWAFVTCVLIQTFFAGMAVFADPSHWEEHRSFVHLFELVPVLMLVTAFAGRLPARLRWQVAGLLALLAAQYATAHMPGAAALHPVIALVLFWQAIAVGRLGWRQIVRAESGSAAERAKTGGR